MSRVIRSNPPSKNDDAGQDRGDHTNAHWAERENSMSTFQMIEHMVNTNMSHRIFFPTSTERKSAVRFSDSVGFIRSSITLAPIPTHTRFLIKGGA